MIFKEFKGLSLSALGFGAMRMPTLPDGSIDQAKLDEIVDYAIANGVNYFDTAAPYHGGMSEGAISRSLKRYPKDKWFLADKYPGHQIVSHYDPAAVFEDQLKKCGVEYFDFYLLHNVNDKSVGTYLDPKWGIIDYFVEQKKLGRIKHLGFSCHSRPEGLRAFLDAAGEHMEFCQIQLNYLDWTLQDAKAKYELLTERGIPVWVMEPVRGGKLSKMAEGLEARLKAKRPEESISSWGFRFLRGLDNVTVVLSGMSNMEQMMDNVKTFSTLGALEDDERELILEVAEKLKDAVPCTACRYCCDGCPAGLDIPLIISNYNDARLGWGINNAIYMSAIAPDKRPAACIACGQCSAVCPQQIDVPAIMADFAALYERSSKWEDICREREEADLREKASRKAE